MKKLFLYSILCSVLLIGCKMSRQLELEPEPFLRWYSSEKNPFRSSDTLEQVCYALSSYPKEVPIALCALNTCESKAVLLADLKSKSEGHSYLLELSTLHAQKDLFELGSQQMGKNDQMLYLNNGIKHDLKALTVKGDTLKCLSAIYEPVLPTKFRILVDFESRGSTPIDHIIFTDRLINSALVRFDFTKTTNTQFPLLNLTNYEK